MSVELSLKLRPAFLEMFNWNQEGMTRKAFFTWARKQRVPAVRLSEHQWRPLRLGEPVTRVTIESFSEYISDHLRLGKFPVAEIAEPSELPPTSGRDRRNDRSGGVWKLGWGRLYSYLISGWQIPEEAYCRNEEDLALAARIVVESVGYHNDHTLSPEKARVLGERIMRRTVDEYVDLLLRFWKGNERSVLFATIDENGEPMRVGVNVVVPLTRGAYERFRDGQMEDMDIRPEDIESPSPFVHQNAVNERILPDMRRAKAARESAQIRTLAYQYSSLFPLVYRPSVHPHIITFAGTPENGKRLESYEYLPVGTRTRETGMAIYEFGKPGRKKAGAAYLKAVSSYMAMRASIMLGQAVLRHDEEQLEAGL